MKLWSKIRAAVMLCLGYVAGDVLEAVWPENSTGNYTAAVGLALMLMPRLPRIFRSIGMGMFISSNTVQYYVAQASGMVVTSISGGA